MEGPMEEEEKNLALFWQCLVFYFATTNQQRKRGMHLILLDPISREEV